MDLIAVDRVGETASFYDALGTDSEVICLASIILAARILR